MTTQALSRPQTTGVFTSRGKHVDIYTYLSLAAGIGGLDLGVERGSGGASRPVCYVEMETSSASVLVSAMGRGILPEAPIWGDLRTFDARPWRGLVDGIVGGYPCQPFSFAGNRGGSNDERNLWPEFERIIDECRPSWCFFENVAGHLSLGYYSHVRPFLESRGFRCREEIVASAEIGASQERRRLFVLAHSGGGVLGYLHGETAGQFCASECPPQPADTDCDVGVRPSSFPPLPDGDWDAVQRRRPDLLPESSVRRMANGSARGHGNRLPFELMGNSVVPAQAALAWQLLWEEIE